MDDAARCGAGAKGGFALRPGLLGDPHGGDVDWHGDVGAEDLHFGIHGRDVLHDPGSEPEFVPPGSVRVEGEEIVGGGFGEEEGDVGLGGGVGGCECGKDEREEVEWWEHLGGWALLWAIGNWRVVGGLAGLAVGGEL